MKVSIIIPIYNVAKYIKRCLTSVLNQTYQNIEIILVDDCGTDDSMKLAREFVFSHPANTKVRFLDHCENRGLSAARNTGIKAATGEYLFFIDSDDEIKYNAIERLVFLANKYMNVDIVQGGIEIVGTVNFLKIDPKMPEFSNCNIFLKQSMLKLAIPVTAWNKLIRKEFLVSNNLWYNENIVNEDEFWTFYAAKVISSLAICKECTYVYYINEGTIMTTLDRRKIDSMPIILCDFVNNIDSVLPDVQKILIEDYAIMYMNKLRITHFSYLYGEKRKLFRKAFWKLLIAELLHLHLKRAAKIIPYYMPTSLSKLYLKWTLNIN